MRKVHPASMVAHLWANKSQDEARTATGNFYFHGSTIWSYGHHFAIAHHLDNGRILWNTSSYSNTTSGQQWDVRRAMTTRQTQDQICVPHLDDNKIRDLERFKSGIVKTGLPAIVEDCRARVIELIQAIASFRSVDKMNANLAQAIEYQNSAALLLDYVKPPKGRNTIGKWPLPAVPHNVPADKPARLAMIASFAKAQLMERYSVNLADHKSTMARIAEMMESPMGYQDQNLIHSLNKASAYLSAAFNAYKTANGDKTFPGYKALHARTMELQKPVEARVKAYLVAEARHDLAGNVRMALLEIHAIKTKGNRFTLSTGRNLRRRFDISRIESCMAVLDGDAGIYADMVARIKRVYAWRECAHELERAENDIESAVSYLPAWPNDALRMYSDAKRKLHYCRANDKFYSVNKAKIDATMADIDKPIEVIKQEIAAKHAAKLGQWLAGENVSLPYDVGTIARIKGDRVETSRGANVPIEHACRLAKIARRVIANGGKTWENNDGPMVGGFRVRSIAADGATVIGCHEFDAPEALRVLGLLDACPACVNVVETV